MFTLYINNIALSQLIQLQRHNCGVFQLLIVANFFTDFAFSLLAIINTVKGALLDDVDDDDDA